MKRGWFITFEGGEGCGKSTQFKKLNQYLTENKISFVGTREPGGCVISEKIRELVLHEKEAITPHCEALLFAAARAQLSKDLILPALEEGKLVLVDRFYDSSIVYQGHARNLGKKEVMSLTRFGIGNLTPDLTFYFKIDPEKGFARKGGADQTDRMELEAMAFHKKVAEGYDMLAKKEKKRIVALDAEKPIETIFEELLQELRKRKIIG